MNHQYEGQLEEPEDDWFDDEDGEWCDARTRELARSTYIELNGQLISCRAYEVVGNELNIRITAGSWEFVDPDRKL